MNDPWHLLIEAAFKQCQQEFDEVHVVTKYIESKCLDEVNARKLVNHTMLLNFRKRWEVLS